MLITREIKLKVVLELFCKSYGTIAEWPNTPQAGSLWKRSAVFARLES